MQLQHVVIEIHEAFISFSTVVSSRHMVLQDGHDVLVARCVNEPCPYSQCVLMPAEASHNQVMIFFCKSISKHHTKHDCPQAHNGHHNWITPVSCFHMAYLPLTFCSHVCHMACVPWLPTYLHQALPCPDWGLMAFLAPVEHLCQQSTLSIAAPTCRTQTVQCMWEV